MDLNAVAAEIRACRACPLHRSARQAVPGDGTGESGLFFLGEAPGYHEDVQGKPFVGAAGQFLDELLAGIALDLARPPAPKPEAEEAKRPAEQITLFG